MADVDTTTGTSTHEGHCTADAEGGNQLNFSDMDGVSVEHGKLL